MNFHRKIITYILFLFLICSTAAAFTYTESIIFYFAENGVPKTGLSPTIDIYRISDNVQVINTAATSEVGGGSYKYFFIVCDTEEEYFWVVDGGAGLLNGQRYAPGSIERKILGEPGDIAPPTSASSISKGSYLYKFLVNKRETTAERIHIYDNTGTNKDHSAVIGDDGTAFTMEEFGAGD